MFCKMYAIEIRNLSKSFHIYSSPADRLKEIFLRKSLSVTIESLKDINLQVVKGETLGIVGKNGAGKSTLLKIVAGTLTPSTGEITTSGRVAALLELGAGFNPEFTGRKNIVLNAALLGLTEKEIREREQDIIDFSELGDFIDRPLKIYSSGMALRLAFAVAASIDPDILIIDEALSVGDGAFARKSFDKIMQFRKSGKSILFCSHSLYQVEALCDRVVWMDKGQIVKIGNPSDIVKSYSDYLASLEGAGSGHMEIPGNTEPDTPVPAENTTTRIEKIDVLVDGESAKSKTAMCRKSELSITVHFASDPALPSPSVAVCLTAANGSVVCSAGTQNDKYVIRRQADGSAAITLRFPDLPLLKGTYGVDVYLMCENGIHLLDHALSAAFVDVSQQGLELGVVTLNHSWQQ